MRRALKLSRGAHHGTPDDVRVKPRESRQMVERIRAAGGKVRYIEAADEGHNLSRPLNLL